jgi:hypothetical protein
LSKEKKVVDFCEQHFFQLESYDWQEDDWDAYQFIPKMHGIYWSVSLIFLTQTWIQLR